MLPYRRLPIALLAPLAFAACDLPTSVGDNTRIMVAVPQEAWDELGPAITAALEPRSFTVRDERIFDIAHVDPRGEDWVDFRKLRQVLVIGEAADPWIATALDEAEGTIPRGPAILTAENVWARPQQVTIVLLPPGSPPRLAAEQMAEVGELYVRRLEEYSRARMFVSGEHEGLADSLASIAGFSMRVPSVYRVTEPEVGLFVFRNDQPDPSDLIRQITVARRPADEVPLTAGAAHAWRGEVVARTTTPPHVTDSIHSSHRVRLADRPAVQVQSTWSNPPGAWPAAGPVITRLVQCPEYTYLVDGWLYAPGRPKYEYMVQIETLLNSFRCAG
jgi:hypothetical protein